MNKSNLYEVQERFLFHSHIRIKMPLGYGSALFNDLFAIMEEVDRRFNSYTEGSYTDLINKNAGVCVETDEEMVSILTKVKYWSGIFEGIYDITVMPLLRLWGFYKNERLKVPTPQQIEETLKLINYKNIEIDGNSVRIAKGQEIITGSFLKAYAVDKVIDKLRGEGVTDAIVNAGGSSIASLNNEEHPFWMINTKAPYGTKREEKSLHLNNKCLSISGQGKTFLEIDGKRYSHILNPVTGYPSENLQVAVITENCFLGDILSTGLFNTDSNDFLRLTATINELEAVEAYLLDKENRYTCTDNFTNYTKVSAL